MAMSRDDLEQELERLPHQERVRVAACCLRRWSLLKRKTSWRLD